MISESLTWVEPLQAAAALGQVEPCWVLLYSGARSEQTGRYSLLALYPQETVEASQFCALADKLSQQQSAFDNAWFGYLSYELLHENEPTLPREKNHTHSLAPLWFCRFGMILRFDHVSQTITCEREAHIAAPHWPPVSKHLPHILPEIATLTSCMTKSRYMEIVEKTLEAIHAGAFYQANITRKFSGTFRASPEPFVLFCRLVQASPASYSAFMHLNGKSVLSSSPECFLTIDASGHMQSRPIKGTAPRFADPAEDNRARETLAASVKDRAENLMIVDLMRNDMARSALSASVVVSDLFTVSSYTTLHHMASTISAQKNPSVSTLEAVKRCFPAGSMTGAPKYRAMQWCLEQEGVQRGLYSGALGWFGGDGSCDLSVVIRTLIVEGKTFEFQVGGGIVADSIPHEEWQETITKARGILSALGLHASMLEAL